MQCFVHRESPAIGVCRVCGRGVCADCICADAAEIYCQGRCEEQGTALAEANQRYLTEHDPKSMARNGFGIGAIILIAGLFCLAYAFLSGEGNDIGTIVIGAFLAICGTSYLLYVRSYYIKHCRSKPASDS